MATTQKVEKIEQVIEKIVFNEKELDELKIAIRDFNKGTITPKQLKQKLIQYRSRIVEEVSNFLIYCLDRTQDNEQAPVERDLTYSNQSDLTDDQLRREVMERNELLEVVAKRINSLILKTRKKSPAGTKSLGLEEIIKIEIERVFSVIRVDEWLGMCGYDDYKFFVKLYPKLEGLYKERFGESENFSDNSKDGKEIMANKMVRLGFPEEVETIVVQYIAIRNIFQHSMNDISPSNLEQAQEAFVKVFVYLIISNLDSKILSNDREKFYSYLKDFFSERLTNNPILRKRTLERLKTVFHH
jgi:hypothetical protein